jgi:Uma2 family endonuclease
MSPLPEHEYFKDILSDAVKDLADELDLDYECYGSSTWKRERGLAGVEPDNCFYFQNERQIRGKLKFDLDVDPPPDLALEVDLTTKPLNRFPIYARLGVPEIWCYDAGQLKLYHLADDTYQEVQQSSIFPALAIQELPSLIEHSRAAGRRAIQTAVRVWVQTQLQR